MAPPRLHRQTLRRPRVTNLLRESESHRLTLVQAGTGYGKSTALATLAEEMQPFAWYHLAAEDADPVVFLLHLFHAFAAVIPELPETPLAVLEEWELNRSEPLWSDVVDSLTNVLASHVLDFAALVVDDAHLMNRSAEALRILDRFIGRAPSTIHTVLASRHLLDLPSLVTWRVRGEALEIGQEELAFDLEETAAFFGEQEGIQLTQEQESSIADKVEGWPIALSLIRQRLQRDDQATIPLVLGQISGSSSELFDYLAREVLEREPQDIQNFLLDTSVLREMTPVICDQLRRSDDSLEILKYLIEHDLFIVDLGNNHSRYHHLIRDVLLHQLPAEQLESNHLQAASCSQVRGDLEESIYHYQAASAYDDSARILSRVGRDLVRAGRLDTLQSWIGNLPPSVLYDHPPLLSYLGDVARLRSHFDEALRWYQQAEERSRSVGDARGLGQALRGQARIYLDIVDASQAERYLMEALRLADGQDDRESKARLLELLAENMLNLSRFQESEEYRNQARLLRHEVPRKDELPVRLLLRTGRLQEARRALEEQAKAEREEPVLRPRAHRETLLLFSLVLSFLGERDKALQAAIEGTERGRQLKSSFISAVGFMRQGHSWLVGKSSEDFEQARLNFQEAIALSETLDVSRLRIEAYWGLCQAFGFQGDVEASLDAASKGIEMAQDVGDLWIEANIRLVMGAAYMLSGQFNSAAIWLAEAGSSFPECGDTFGEMNTILWQCLLWNASSDAARLERDVSRFLKRVRNHNYEFIFYRKTLLGPIEPQTLFPLLLFARAHDIEAAYVDRILLRLNLPDLEFHPGYQLKVYMLGAFSVWRGNQPVGRKDWSRKKALQLFQLLVSNRDKMLERELITDILWPELDPGDARRDFKVAFSALRSTLEPDRRRNAPSAYIVRDGTLYGMRQGADLYLDVEQFESLISSADGLFDAAPEDALPHYQEALALYRGNYLQECLYDEWCVEERERLQTQFLRVADRVAVTLAAQRDWEETIAVCQEILAYDDCWEGAYRLMMVAFDKLGKRTQALRTYQKCVDKLQTELGVVPSPATVELYEAIH